MLIKILFSCDALALDLSYRPLLLEETLAIMSNFIELCDLLSLKVHVRHNKDPSLL